LTVDVFWPVLLALPWVVLVLFMVLRVRLPTAIPEHPASWSAPPLVSVIVPARNEERSIETVLRSLTASRYPAFEILVVDDRSDDDTRERARTVDRGGAARLEVIVGEPLPEGWLGKPWACWQGASRARGDLLVFTDADTVHGPDLLGRAVAYLDEEEADAVTLMGRQLLETFWERVVQPHIFLAMWIRYPALARPLRPERWASAIANGQYILFRREVYESFDGHRSVRGEVVEDQALAQGLVRSGYRLSVGGAEADFATRMYRSLGEIVAGWSKNLILGGLRSLPAWLRPIAPPLMLLSALILWLLPPALLVAALIGTSGGPSLVWASCITGLSALFWALVCRRMGVPGRFGLLYPLGAAVGLWIMVRSWSRMGRVEWKGREYRVESP